MGTKNRIKPLSKDIDADQPIPTLAVWVGSWPERVITDKDVDLFVACARERIGDATIAARNERGQKITIPAWWPQTITPDVDAAEAPLRDDAEALTPHELIQAQAAAVAIAKALQAGRRVFVACSKGENRSCFCAGLALMMLSRMSADDVVELMRKARGKEALSNNALVAVLKRFYGGLVDRQAAEAAGNAPRPPPWAMTPR